MKFPNWEDKMHRAYAFKGYGYRGDTSDLAMKFETRSSAHQRQVFFLQAIAGDCALRFAPGEQLRDTRKFKVSFFVQAEPGLDAGARAHTAFMEADMQFEDYLALPSAVGPTHSSLMISTQPI